MTDSQVRTDAIAAEAAEWHARLRSENVSELDAARFRTWLAGDPARREEFEAITRFWDEIAAIEASPEVQQARASIAARRRHARQIDTDDSRSTSRSWRKRGIVTAWATAAAALLAVCVNVLVDRVTANRFVTQVGEQRTVPLEDGSVVKLNTATEMRLRYAPDMRAVELVSGQATFEVAKDQTRPFVVIAGGGSVRALGTVFDVYKEGDLVRVTLIEGRVAILPSSHAIESGSAAFTSSRNAERSGEQILLEAGEQAAYGAALTPTKPASVDVQRAVAWQARKLDFSDTPLHEAILEANRYSNEKIILDAPHLAGARISGTFEAGRNELFAEGLQSYFRLALERRADGSILLTSPGR